MVFAGPSSPSSTDSDTESVGTVGKTGSCPLFPRMRFAGPFSPVSINSESKSGGMEEGLELKLGLNSDQLTRKAMRGQSAYPDALVGGENGKSPVAGRGGGMEEAPAAVEAGEVTMHNPKMYTLEEIKIMTRNFRPPRMPAEDEFGVVYRGYVDERTLAPSKAGSGIWVAVGDYRVDRDLDLGEWQLSYFKYSHPNLVRLLGYCWEDKRCLLVHEYMQRGSLENHLFRGGDEPLPWEVRLKIAIGAARGLDFLHTSEKTVIYREFKSSNILLDADYNAKLSDFVQEKLGLAGGNSHETTLMIRTYGYAAPEYITKGYRSVKSNVYGFGVVLLEILTGLQALNNNWPEWYLVGWARPSLHDERKLRKIMDRRLRGEYPPKAATQAAKLILKCLEDDPKARPSMDEVLATLEHINTIRKKET